MGGALSILLTVVFSMWVELPAEPPDLEAMDALAMKTGLEAQWPVAHGGAGAVGGGPRFALPGL